MIHGKTIYLRAFAKSDIPLSHTWLNDPELGSIMGYLPFPIEAQEAWFETTVNSREKFVFAICDQATDQHVGNVAIGAIDAVSRNGMLSIFIAEPSIRGRGVGEDATRLILDFAFDRLNLHRVHLKASAFSEAAIAMYKKVGFQKEGVLREHEFKDGKYVDKVLFGLLRQEHQEGTE